jgi:hypothetical protein
MQQVKAALDILDEHVLQHGTHEMKAATREGKAAVARAEDLAKKTPLLHERQRASDAQLTQAGQLLGEAHPVFVAN